MVIYQGCCINSQVGQRFFAKHDHASKCLAGKACARSTILVLSLVFFACLLLSGCMMPSFWLDESDFRDNLPDNSIKTYFWYWASDAPEVRLKKLYAAYRDDFLKMFPLGDSVLHAKDYLIDIGAKCDVSKFEIEMLETCVYRRKIKTYRGWGYFGANKSFWAEKLLMYEGWDNVIYEIKSIQNTITDINVEKTSEPIYTYRYMVSPEEKQDIEKQIQNCRPPDCIRNF